MKQIVMTT